MFSNIAVVIGMPRSGTTWLYENLKLHPDACVSDVKEINRYLKDMSDQKYLAYFNGCNDRVMMDISPLYYFDLNALREISRRHDKVILITRDADDWIASLNKQVGKYNPQAKQMEASGRYSFRIDKGKAIEFDYQKYSHNQYLDEIKEIFGGKLLCLNYSMLTNDSYGFLKKVEQYLSLSSFFNPDNYISQKYNAGEKRISPIYSYLYRSGWLDRVSPLLRKVLPRKMMHWLRKWFVYGG